MPRQQSPQVPQAGFQPCTWQRDDLCDAIPVPPFPPLPFPGLCRRKDTSLTHRRSFAYCGKAQGLQAGAGDWQVNPSSPGLVSLVPLLRSQILHIPCCCGSLYSFPSPSPAMKPLWRGWGPAGLDILPPPPPHFMQYFLVFLACPSPLGAPPALHTCQGLAPCLPEEGQVNTSGPRLVLATLHPATGSSTAMDRIFSALLISLLLLLQSYGVYGTPPQQRGK